MRQLIRRIDKMRNPSVVGLDPTPELIPKHILEQGFDKYGKSLKGLARAYYLFNMEIIDAVCDIVPAVKPQCAYYEALGWHGVKCLDKTISYARKKGMYVIVDGKRNDIGSTMSAYATAYLGTISIGGHPVSPFDGQALTVNGYLGSDGIQPLLSRLEEDEHKGIFVLVKTSNPSSGELQDKHIGGEPLYMHVGKMVEAWGRNTRMYRGYSQVGAVVGATYPEQLVQLRRQMPHTLFLVPGYGAQGGTARDVAGAFDRNGRGAIVNSSRGIIGAWKKAKEPKNFAQLAREAAVFMRSELRRD